MYEMHLSECLALRHEITFSFSIEGLNAQVMVRVLLLLRLSSGDKITNMRFLSNDLTHLSWMI